jgi:hypothetical protein
VAEVLGDEKTDRGGPRKCWMIKERTEGWLGVRLGQDRKVLKIYIHR